MVLLPLKSTKSNQGIVEGASTRTTKPTPPQALRGVKINKLAGSITGQLFISERQDGDKLGVTLNTKHALYQSFIDEIKKQ